MSGPPFWLAGPVGVDARNDPRDVQAVVDRFHELALLVGQDRSWSTPCAEGAWPGAAPATASPVPFVVLVASIRAFQRRFTMRPDGRLDPGGEAVRFLRDWERKPIAAGVQLPGRLRQAWDLVDPLLPKGSYCSSGFRSPAEQRAILHKFFLTTQKERIVALHGLARWQAAANDLAANEDDVLRMVRSTGQQIAAPGRSLHQQGKAIDVGGPAAIDAEQVRVIRLVAAAHPHLLSGKVLRERNGCVHFELR